MEHYDLICIGCGPAGEKAATQAAYFKKRIAVIEAQPRPGGAMVNTGTIPSKALRETALLCSSFRRRPVPGVNLHLEEHLSISRFMAQRHLIQQEEHDRIELSFDRHGIDVIPGHGRIVDSHTVAVTSPDRSERVLHARNILIATGSSPFRPSNIPIDDRCVVDADGILELDHMPRRMLIVGGGVIGSEYACIFAEIGTEVVLVEPRDRILPFVDDDIRAVLVRAMQDLEIDLRFETTVDSIDVNPTHTEARVVFDCAHDGHTEDVFDTVLWAAGRTGNTQSIGLENVHIFPDKRGYLQVNEHYQTSVPSIYAAGDVIGFPALTSTSMEQGRIAACHMFGIDFKQHIAESFPIGLYTIPPVASVGMSEQDAKRDGVSYVVGSASYRMNARGRMYRENAGLVKLIYDRPTGALLGAAIVGEQATELIHIAQAALAGGLGMSYFIDSCFNYPSISDLYKYATYDALQHIDTELHRTDRLGEAASRAA